MSFTHALKRLFSGITGNAHNTSMDKETFLIVGLGNPGSKYAGTRHNCGFAVIDRLVRELNAPMPKEKLRGMIYEIPDGDRRIVLCKPQTFMNSSGECIAELLRWYKCPPDHLLVIYDDIDLPIGKTRMRKAGSSGTHNGMRSIQTVLPQGNYPRIRIGVGAQPEGWDLVDWVLGTPLSKEELEALQQAFDRAASCALDFVRKGSEHAMQLCNRNP